MWKDTEVSRRLKINLPIIQGPFGGGASSVELAAIVSEAGGLGSFGANHLQAGQIKDVIENLRQKTAHPFAINLWIPFEGSDESTITDEAFAENCQRLKPYFDELNLPLPPRPERFSPSFTEQMDALLETRPPAFSFVFGIPSDDILNRCRELEIITVGTATTPAEAIVLDKAGVDLIVASGFEGGGHRTAFLKQPEDSLFGTFALIPQVVDAVKTPVIAAGGIADGRGIAAALALGAQGVQIGTAFLACEESGANPLHRAALWSQQARSTQLTRAFSGRLARGIENRFMFDFKNEQTSIPAYPIQNWFTNQLKATAIEKQMPDLISLWCGQARPLLRHHHAETLIESLVNETNEIIKKLGKSPDAKNIFM